MLHCVDHRSKTPAACASFAVLAARRCRDSAVPDRLPHNMTARATFRTVVALTLAHDAGTGINTAAGSLARGGQIRSIDPAQSDRGRAVPVQRQSGDRAAPKPPGQPPRAWGLGGGNASRKMPRSRDDALRTWQRTIATPTTRARDQTKGAHGFVARASDAMGRDGRF